MLTPLTEADPRAVGPYRLQNRIGSGGMGTVYLGFTEGHKAVAVKVATAALAEDAEFRARFRREVGAAQRVRGKAVASVLDADTDAYQPWLVTEYVEGVNLTDAVRARGRLDDHLVRGLAVGLADALVAIHAAGVIHRDLKPSNILLAWDGPKVIDFGIAHLTDSTGLTRTGTVIGTLAWMAPEQMRGDPVTATADVFAWATCVTYAATGRHPFHADTAEQLARRVQTDSPDIPDLPDYVASLVPRALSKNPYARPTANELLAGLVGREVRDVVEADDLTGSVLEQTWTGPSPASPSGPPLPAHSLPPHPRPAHSYSAPPGRSSAPAWQPAARPREPSIGSTSAPAPSLPNPAFPNPSYPNPWPAAGGRAESSWLEPQPPWSPPAAPGAQGASPYSPQAVRGASPYSPQPASAVPHHVGAIPRPAMARRPRRWNLCAVLSLIFGVTWVFGIGSGLAVVFGYVGRSQARTRGERGGTVARVGIVLGWIGIVITALLVIAASAAKRSLEGG